ncbi:hypothetical protein MUG91_G102n57 [Manis pentadactyla]|nr:hypothetical protein MUG91_G102n57 [Manis pentadactyla]
MRAPRTRQAATLEDERSRRHDPVVWADGRTEEEMWELSQQGQAAEIYPKEGHHTSSELKEVDGKRS